MAGLPNGALVLPGLDQTLDEESWNAIVPAHPEHPQFGLKKLLDALGVRREDVLAAARARADGGRSARARRLVSEAMRPAGTTERWHRFTASADKRGDGAGAGGRRHPGGAERRGRGGGDRAHPARGGRDAGPDGGAGVARPPAGAARRGRGSKPGACASTTRPASRSPRLPSARFLDLVVEAAAKRFEPVALSSLLKHPLCRLGMAAAELRRAARALELAAFRAPYFGQGLDGVAAALERAQADMRAGKRRHRAVRAPAGTTIGRRRASWRSALRPGLPRRWRQLFRVLGQGGAAHARQGPCRGGRGACHARQRRAGRRRLWQGEAGEEAAKFFAGLLDGDTAGAGHGARPTIPSSTAASSPTRAFARAGAAHPRISIWEPYESRLQQPDVVILGSLNEGTWPQAADPGPGSTGRCAQTLGLPAPEERIGDAAHIFTSLLGVDRVYLTRAAKIDGVPTVPSRWLLRLQALLGGLGQTATPDRPWLAWAQARNALGRPGQARACARAAPAARAAAAPAQRHDHRELDRQPLRHLRRSASWAWSRCRCSARRPTRRCAARSCTRRSAASPRAFPTRLPDDVCAELHRPSPRPALAELTGSPRVAAFWAPRFARFAAWFAETEPDRRAGMRADPGRGRGRAWCSQGPAGPFTLTARADRIDVGDGGLVITDYKTGANIKDAGGPRRRRARRRSCRWRRRSPRRAASPGCRRRQVAALRYISASGGEPPGQECTVEERRRRAAGARRRGWPGRS